MNPQVIGSIGLFALLVWLPTLVVAATYAFRQMHSRERLKAIEHGIDLAFDPQAAADGTRRAGVVLISLGVGLALADGILVLSVGDADLLVLLGVAVVPFAVGVGLLVDYRIARREVRK